MKHTLTTSKRAFRLLPTEAYSWPRVLKLARFLLYRLTISSRYWRNGGEDARSNPRGEVPPMTTSLTRLGMLKIAKQAGCGVSVVQRVLSAHG